MAVADSNGKPSSPAAAIADTTAMNGQPNGSIHHHAPRQSRHKRRNKTTVWAWTLDKALRLAALYTIVTFAVRCPASIPQLTADSPRICKPYLQTRDYLAPYAQPYYDHFLAPYVQQAQPYVDRLNSQVYQPSLAVYQQHGAPRVAQAQQYGRQQWERAVKPQLTLLQKETGKQYEKHLSPHVKTAQQVVQPYYDTVKSSAGDIWELELEPVYRKTVPYAEKLYTQGQDFAVKTAIPQAQLAGNSAWTFWARQIWPRMRILYGENVEPQLLRITERLGRYKDGKKLEADIQSMESSSKLAEASANAKSVASSIASTVKEATASPSVVASQALHDASPEAKPDPKVQFEADLKSWEQICAKAVEEGSEDLNERIQDLTERQSKTAESVGAALVTQLEQTSESALNSVKARIQQITRDLPEDADAEQLAAGEEELVLSIRAAGQNIKQRAQAVRDWRQSAQADTQDLVAKALQSTLETIDHIRDLRLTEIGRKYASSSLPHKEWSKYNELKKSTQAWRNGVEERAHAHQGIVKAKSRSEDIEQQAMAIAEDAAKELGRLKEVGKWKIAAGEDSDDFSTRYVPPPVRKIKEKIVEKVAEASQAVLGQESEKGNVESATSLAAEKASQVASGVSEAIMGSSTGSVESAASKISEKVIGSKQPAVENLSSHASVSVESAASFVSEAVHGTESGLADTATEGISSLSSAILGTPSGLSDSATDVASAVSSAIIGSETPLAESVASSLSSLVADKPATKSINSNLSSMLSAQKANVDTASKSVQSIVHEAKESGSSILEQATGSSPGASKVSASIVSAASEASSHASRAASAVQDALPNGDDVSKAAGDAVHAATESPKKVFAGAMAQVLVEAREPIMDDVVDSAGSLSANIQSMASVAGDKASALTQAVQDALKRATATQGSVESITSLASEQYESALAAASSVLFGTQKNVAEKGSIAVKEQYLSAVTAASYAIYGTPVTAAPFAQASSAYDSAVSEAAKHYNNVKSRLSEQISGTPEPIHQQMYSSAEAAYSAAVGAASERLQAALGSTTPNTYESISSVAASRLASAVSAASAQYKSAKIAVGVEPTPVHQQYLASAQKAYYEALGVAHGRYSEFLEAASSVLTPSPTATGISQQFDSAMSGARAGYSQYMSDASSKYSALLSQATAAASGSSSAGKDTLENLQAQLADASALASSKLAAASSDISVAVYGTEPAVFDSIASKASENWEALISKASEQVYGAPPPFTDQVASRATEYAAYATEAASAQWDAVSGLFSELLSGREPDFTESVYSRLQSAYSTGAPAIASKASVAASVAYESAASVVSAIFVPPTEIPGILEQVQEQLNAAVDAASAQLYGTSKGTIQQATEAAGSAYSQAASQVSEAVYGRESGYAELAQANIINIGASASSVLQAAVYGTPTNTLQAVSGAAASVYSSIASQAAEHASAASAAVSSALYGEEQTYLEGIQSQVAAAMASASSRISELGVQASKAAGEGAGYVSSAAEEAASSVSSAAKEAASSVSSIVGEASGRVRDEL